MIINQPINQSTNQPINQSTNQPINQSTNQPINQSTNQPINQSTNQPIKLLTRLFFNPFLLIFLSLSLSLACSSSGGDSSSPVALPVLTITPDDDSTPRFSVNPDGEGVLEENDAGTAAIRLGKIGDSIDADGSIAYALVEDTNDPDKYDNEHFSITESDGAYYLYYKGAALDYDTLDAADRTFTLNIVRTRDADGAGGTAADKPQAFEYIVNVQNINEHAPILTAEGGTVAGTKLEILFDFTFEFFDSSDNGLRITLEDMPSTRFAHDLEIVLKNDAGNQAPIVTITAKQAETNIIEQIEITYYRNLSFIDAVSLIRSDFAELLGDDFDVNDGDNVENVGGSNVFTQEGTKSLTSTPILRVDKDTQIGDIIANFADNDLDGDLNDFTYSVSDNNLFFINENGELSFKTAPSFDSSAGADNNHEVTITVSDGTNSDTYDLLVQVIE